MCGSAGTERGDGPRAAGAAEAARGFMPADEGLALHDAAASVPSDVDGPFLEVGSLLRQVGGLPGRRGAVGAAGCCSRSTTTGARRRTSRVGVARARPRRPRRRADGHAAVVPPHGPRRRPRGRRDRRRRRLAGRRRALVDAARASCSSTAATAPSPPTATTRAGPRTSRRAGSSPSTTCSPTPPTAAARRTRSTCRRSSRGASTRCRRPARSASSAVAERVLAPDRSLERPDQVRRTLGVVEGDELGEDVVVVDEQPRRRGGAGEGVGGEHDRRRRVGRPLAAGEVDLVGVHDAGPVASRRRGGSCCAQREQLARPCPARRRRGGPARTRTSRRR